VRRLSIALLVVCACAGATPAPSTSTVAASTPAAPKRDASAELQGLFESEWERHLKLHPVEASRLGDRRYDAEWGDRSLAALASQEAHDREIVTTLRAFPRPGLSDEDRLDLDLYLELREQSLTRHALALDLFVLDHIEGIQVAHELADELRFTTVADYENWIARLGKMGDYVTQTIEVMREGIRQKRVHPRVIMERVPAQLDTQIVARAEDSPFYKPFRKWPEGVVASDRERLAQSARVRIAEVVVPGFKRLKAFFASDYLPAAPAEVGLGKEPRGDEAYAFLARTHTTTKLTPDEIHATGMAEVARIRAAMEALMRKTGFKGALPDFFKFLRTDPRFYEKTPEALLRAYAVTAKRVDPLLVKVVGTLPRTPYGVEPIPDASAPYQTTAYYKPPAEDGTRAGRYMVNLFKPESRPTWEIMALTMHEAVPGHHLQIALASEQKALPHFRRHGRWTAFVEGWALYAESLGDEMGLYDDPYAKFGQLAYEMWRAVRLVVDTGMHAKGWDRARAIAFFSDNAPRKELDVTNEIDRYIAWPGQALAYEIGALKIKELRARATKALGAKFDVRAFHDALLARGALPLDVLEARMEAWVAAQPK
jgi:uncharacterized protein (DUF885 family)